MEGQGTSHRWFRAKRIPGAGVQGQGRTVTRCRPGCPATPLPSRLPPLWSFEGPNGGCPQPSAHYLETQGHGDGFALPPPLWAQKRLRGGGKRHQVCICQSTGHTTPSCSGPGPSWICKTDFPVKAASGRSTEKGQLHGPSGRPAPSSRAPLLKENIWSSGPLPSTRWRTSGLHDQLHSRAAPQASPLVHSMGPWPPTSPGSPGRDASAWPVFLPVPVPVPCSQAQSTEAQVQVHLCS